MTEPTSPQNSERPALSVIVATLNRSDSLERECLASLAAQELPGRVELIVCDASDDRLSEEIVQRWSKTYPTWACTYVRAAQRGSCSQRNQGVRLSRGRLLLFLDDDAELMPHALDELWKVYLESGEAYAGYGLQLIVERDAGLGERLRKTAWLLGSSFWCRQTLSNRRRLLRNGFNAGGRPITPAAALELSHQADAVEDVDWMNGSSMAIRREVFFDLGLRFDERLQRFGGYAVGEDVAISTAIRATTHRRLAGCRRSWAIHHVAPGPRASSRSLAAAAVYNRYVIWCSMASRQSVARWLCWMWTQTAQVIVSLVSCLRNGDTAAIAGTVDGWRAARLLHDRRATTGRQGET